MGSRDVMSGQDNHPFSEIPEETLVRPAQPSPCYWFHAGFSEIICCSSASCFSAGGRGIA